MSDQPERRAVTGAADAELAGALARRLLRDDPVRARIRMIVGPSLVSTSDVLADLSHDRSLSLVTTSMAGVDATPPVPQYYAEGALLMPVDTDDGAFWAEVDEVTFWDCGIGLALAVAGITPDGTLDAFGALAATPPPLAHGLERSLADLGWQERSYHAPSRAWLLSDGVDLEVALGEGRGLAVEPVAYEIQLRAAPGATFPSWPVPDAVYDPDAFVRAVVGDWPDDVPTSPWRGA
ncbi:hypothetical protein AB0J35_27640 [Nonomuraea angiospora]|uniref:hypothetical protein n=1 Tax=Nonomuraea angiospora TaxID=46172 RepID=UPI003431E83B